MSEIFVVSDNSDAVAGNPIGAANYYDMLLRNAFGNYKDLLRDVSLHPLMGAYLSHLRNDKSDPRSGRFPDENYAREVMQLFSIGLFQLKPDGTLQKDGRGRPIPTYDNDDITELAKIFTGLAFDGANRDFYDGEERLDPPHADVRGAPRAGFQAPHPRAVRPGRPDRHAGRECGHRQPVPPPERRTVPRASSDPAADHLEPEPGVHPARVGGVRERRARRARQHESGDSGDPARP